jgi:UDPglucose 6-dehydrogenase
MSAPVIAVLGAWHQGLVASGCLAETGYAVRAWDASSETMAGLRQGKLPIFEPGLDDLIAAGVESGKLTFADNLTDAVRGADYVFLMFDTPVDENDNSDLSGIFAAVTEAAPRMASDVTIYVTAQLPFGTSAKLLKIVRDGGARNASIAYTPENLQLGAAIARFKSPPLPVIGTDDDAAFERLAKLLAPYNANWQRCTLATAEMLKHALNAFLAVNICFANELGNLCDALGADGVRLAELLRLEPRVGPKAMLMPGLGFAGGTLARDMISLRSLGDKTGIDTLTLDGAWNSNKSQNTLVFRRLEALLSGVKGKRIAVLGLTYKADTSTLRRSAAMELIADLAKAGATIAAHDPMADPVEASTHADVRPDPYDAASGADAIVLMTPWKQYRELDLAKLCGAMKGTLLFDSARLWQADAALKAGFTYVDIGRGRAPTANAETLA